MKFRLSNPFDPPSAPPAFGLGKTIPEKSSPLVFNCLYFQHICQNRFLSLGFFQGLSSIGFHLFLRLDSPDHSNQTVYPSQIWIFCQSTISTDLWELPQSQLTSAITDKAEKNFYSRCPLEMRPRFMNFDSETQKNTISQTSLDSPSNNTATGDTENDKPEYGPDMEKVCRNNSIYDTRTGIGIGTGTRTTYY